ncbi:hypothetical protein ACFWWM_12225 [Streptomyces sp. NPDC058682]|uniref:hypothetical protein n=1 Tax=Streptomyces sp. NPDC058682 TaxID=3346596 RepID=UPI00365D86A0
MTTLVAAMATNVWEGTRDRVVELVRRRDPDRAAALRAQLNGDADLVHDDLVRPGARRIAALLRDHPEAADGVRAVVEEAALPHSAQSW